MFMLVGSNTLLIGSIMNVTMPRVPPTRETRCAMAAPCVGGLPGGRRPLVEEGEGSVSESKRSSDRTAPRAGLVPAFPAGPTGARTRPTFSLDSSLLAGTYEHRAVRPCLPDCPPPGPAEAAAFGGAVLTTCATRSETRHSIGVSAWDGSATTMTTRATAPSSTSGSRSSRGAVRRTTLASDQVGVVNGADHGVYGFSLSYLVYPCALCRLVYGYRTTPRGTRAPWARASISFLCASHRNGHVKSCS